MPDQLVPKSTLDEQFSWKASWDRDARESYGFRQKYMKMELPQALRSLLLVVFAFIVLFVLVNMFWQTAVAVVPVLLSAVSATPIDSGSWANLTTHAPDADGKYTIKSEGVRAQFVAYGASLSNFFIKDKHGIERDIVMGFDNASYYEIDRQHPHLGGVPGTCHGKDAWEITVC